MSIVDQLRADGVVTVAEWDAIRSHAADEIERLRQALEFYARPIVYQGDNQRNLGNDPFTPTDDPYIKSVGRDGGKIARTALKE